MVRARTVKGADLWQTVDILIDGEDQGDNDSLAVGYWNGVPCLGSRYDRRDDQKTEIGFPYVYAHPCWCVRPDWMNAGIIAVSNLDQAKRKKAMAFLADGVREQ
jgi:hypothetical protein